MNTSSLWKENIIERIGTIIAINDRAELKMSVCNLCWASEVCTGAKWPTQPELIMVSKAWANQEYHCSSPGLEAGPLQGLTPSISPGFPKNLPVPTYILGWAEVLWGEGFWSRTQHTDQVIGLKCGPLNPKSNALNIKPLHRHYWTSEREHLLPKLTLVELWHHCPVVRDYQHALKNKVHMCST